MSFDDFDEVPEAKSSFSTRAVLQPPAGGVEGHPGPGDPAPDDQHVERLAGQARQRPVAVERVGAEPSTSGRVSDMGRACHSCSDAGAGRAGTAGRHRSGASDFDNDCQLTIVGDTLSGVRTPDELTELFRATGRKVTAQRQCIFRILQGDETHPSAEAVHAAAVREMETISLKTVYQTLHDLAELGEIAALDVGTGTTRFDPNVDDPHHHLVCRSCGSVRDLVVDFPELTVPEAPTSASTSAPAEVIFRGLCPDCRSDGAAPSTAVTTATV